MINFLKKLFGDESSIQTEKTEETYTENTHIFTEPVYEDEYTRLGLIREIDENEKQLVSVIASAIFAGANSDIKVKIKSVKGVDGDKINAIAIISAIAATDRPDSVFRLVSINEVKN